MKKIAALFMAVTFTVCFVNGLSADSAAKKIKKAIDNCIKKCKVDHKKCLKKADDKKKKRDQELQKAACNTVLLECEKLCTGQQ